MIFRNEYIFWTDVNSDRIYRAQINGSNPMIIVNTGLSCTGTYLCALYSTTQLDIVVMYADRWSGLGLGKRETVLDR